jgi:hypothetical protein
MFKREVNILTKYQFFVGDREYVGNLFYTLDKPLKTEQDIKLLEMQMRRDIAERYKAVQLPNDIVIDNIMEL